MFNKKEALGKILFYRKIVPHAKIKGPLAIILRILAICFLAGTVLYAYFAVLENLNSQVIALMVTLMMSIPILPVFLILIYPQRYEYVIGEKGMYVKAYFFGKFYKWKDLEYFIENPQKVSSNYPKNLSLFGSGSQGLPMWQVLHSGIKPPDATEETWFFIGKKLRFKDHFLPTMPFTQFYVTQQDVPQVKKILSLYLNEKEDKVAIVDWRFGFGFYLFLGILIAVVTLFGILML